MKRLDPKTKGLITGCCMVAASILIYVTNKSFENRLQYIPYTMYATGIAWALAGFSKTPGHANRFGAYFSQGFRCFIVVTLLMVLYTIAFLLLHPQLKEEMASIFRADLLKSGNYTPNEIEEKIKMARKSFLPSLVMGAVFGYLAIGAMVTSVATLIFLQKKPAAYRDAVSELPGAEVPRDQVQ